MLFFALGFVVYYSRFWRWLTTTRAEKTGINRAVRLLPALAAIATAILFDRMASGRLLHVGGLLQHGMGLFVVSFIILDADIWPSELVVRAAGLMAVWGLSHGELGWSVVGTAARLFALLWALASWYLGPRIRYHIVPHFVWLMLIAVVYWGTIPSVSAGFRMSPLLIIQALVLYACAVLATALYLYLMRQEERESAMYARRATYDALTNAKTYAVFRADISRTFNNAHANGQPLTIASIDVDHFKQVNDHYGHLAGNEVLIGVATTLQKELDRHPGEHSLYRTGGEEFSIIFNEIPARTATAIVRACWAAVKNSTYHASKYAIRVTISAGITAVRVTDNHLDELLKRADDNLYQSKQHGRDTITVEGDTLHDTTHVQPQQLYAYCTAQVRQLSGNHADMTTEVLTARYEATTDQWHLVPGPRSFTHQYNFVQQVAQEAGKIALTVHLTLADCQSTRTRAHMAAVLARNQRPTRLRVLLAAPVPLMTLAALRADYQHLDVGFVLGLNADSVAQVTEPLLPLLDGIRLPLSLLRAAEEDPDTAQHLHTLVAQCRQHDVVIVVSGIDNSVDADYVRQKWPVDGGCGYFVSHPDLPRID